MRRRSRLVLAAALVAGLPGLMGSMPPDPWTYCHKGPPELIVEGVVVGVPRWRCAEAHFERHGRCLQVGTFLCAGDDRLLVTAPDGAVRELELRPSIVVTSGGFTTHSESNGEAESCEVEPGLHRVVLCPDDPGPRTCEITVRDTGSSLLYLEIDPAHSKVRVQVDRVVKGQLAVAELVFARGADEVYEIGQRGRFRLARQRVLAPSTDASRPYELRAVGPYRTWPCFWPEDVTSVQRRPARGCAGCGGAAASLPLLLGVALFSRRRPRT